MDDYEQWGVEVAADLHARFERSLQERPAPLAELAVGTSGPWLWVVYRLTDAFSGRGSSAFLRGLAIDLREAEDEFLLMGASDSLVSAVWFGEIAEPQGVPGPPESEFLEGVWWRCIPQ